MAAELTVLAAPEITSCPPATSGSAKPRFFVSASPRPSAAQHSYPFAVGPPRRNVLTFARAGDTHVSGNSAARRMLVPRVAAVLLSSEFPRPTRDENPVLIWAACFSK